MKRFFLAVSIAIIFTTTSIAQSGNAKMIKLLEDYTELNQEFYKAYLHAETKKVVRLRKSIEATNMKKILPALADIESQYCSSLDKQLLGAYTEMLESIEHSAFESPRYTFGKMYLCDPDGILEAVKASEKPGQLAGDLEFGFENVVSDVDKARYDIPALRARIAELR